MVEKNPSIIEKVYEGAVFTGETLLHIAIVKKNLTVASELVIIISNYIIH